MKKDKSSIIKSVLAVIVSSLLVIYFSMHSVSYKTLQPISKPTMQIVGGVVPDLHKEHYHSSENHNGNLYALRLIGYDTAHHDDPSWKSELWKYDRDGHGVQLFSSHYLTDFRVSDDEKFVVVFEIKLNKEKTHTFNIVSFLDTDGTLIKALTTEDLHLDKYVGQASDVSVKPEIWSIDTLWISYGSLDDVLGVAKIDLATFTVTNFDLQDLLIIYDDFNLNPSKQKIVYSDYPAIFDADSGEQLLKSKKIIHLFIYDLVTKKKEVVATSVAKLFKPTWINADILEYNNPNGEGRVKINNK